MRTRNKLVLILNPLVYLLFLFPVRQLDLFKENYSTLSLNTRGYLYLFFLGIITGGLMGYETFSFAQKKRGIALFVSMLIGTMIPHHVPYNIQGNLHLIFGYLGFFGLMSITYLNVFEYGNKKLMNLYMIGVLISILLYIRYQMVTTLFEVIIMADCMFVNMYLYLKREVQ